MTALETKDIGNQIEVLLEKYESTSSVKAKGIIEECIASNLGAIERMVLRGDIEEHDYEHYKTLTYLVTTKEIEPDRKYETPEEREVRVIKRALDNYADKYRQQNKESKKVLIDSEVKATLRMLATKENYKGYWQYYSARKVMKK